MKNLYIYITLAFSLSAFSQNGNVGIGTTSPAPSAALDMVSTDQGLLVNRVLLSDVTDTATPINSPADGLLVYNTNATVTGGDGEGFYYFDGTQWVKIGTAPGWSLTGNGGTIAGTNFLGTTNNQDFIISTNTLEAIRVEAGNDIGIGTNNPTALFHVEGSAIPSTVYSMDFEGSTASVTISDNAGTGTWQYGTTSGYTDCSAGCTDTRAFIAQTGSVSDDDITFGPFMPLQTTIDVSFNFGHIQPSTGSSKDGDIFRVELLQGGAVVQTLLNLADTTATNQLFSATGIPVTPGLNYSLRATLIDRYIASIDNILVTQASVSVMRIQDGSEQDGHVLTSDANGYASWRDPKVALAEEDWAFFSGSGINDPMYHQGLVRAGSTAVATKTLDIDYGANAGSTYANSTSFGLGSVELFVQFVGEDGVRAANNDIAPQIDNTNTLGESTLAWTEIFLTDPVITTSDERLKENMKPLAYGINDVMKLQPSQYYWKDKHYIERGVPLNDKRLKLGLIAQELLETIPEVVTTHQWVKKSEKENDTFVLKENERLGVNYAELIPVLVKATQDQQEFIERLKKENEKLEKELAKK